LSYSISIGTGPVSTFGDRADEALANSGTNDDQAEAAAKAIDIVKGIVGSGIVGNGEAHCSASVSGHGNPGQEYREGYSRDYVSISVQQQATPVPPDAGAN